MGVAWHVMKTDMVELFCHTRHVLYMAFVICLMKTSWRLNLCQLVGWFPDHLEKPSHCFHWKFLSRQLFPFRTKWMKSSSVIDDVIDSSFQLFHVPSHNLANLAPSLFSYLRSAHDGDSVSAFPGIIPETSSAPAPNRSGAASHKTSQLLLSWYVAVLSQKLLSWCMLFQMPEKWGTPSSCMIIGMHDAMWSRPDARQSLPKSSCDPKHSAIASAKKGKSAIQNMEKQNGKNGKTKFKTWCMCALQMLVARRIRPLII